MTCSTIKTGTAFTPGTQAPPSTPCRGAALSDCDGIERPEPRCDPMTCAWGSVSHTYNCPAALTCDMDCYGCGAGDGDIFFNSQIMIKCRVMHGFCDRRGKITGKGNYPIVRQPHSPTTQ